MAKTMNNELMKKLWASADALRGNISSEQYMHIVIGVMFLKHMSDKYNVAIEKIKKEEPDSWELLIKEKDVLSNYGVSFLIPEKARWEYIAKNASSPQIGEVMDNAFELIEEANQELQGLFDKDYNREELEQSRLGQVVSEFSNVDLNEFGEDVIGRTYEYFLGEFFKKQGQKGGEFYTPQSIVDLMTQIVGPHKGKIYDPTAGTGGMLVQARKHIIDNGGDPDGLVAYGQELMNKTWKLSRINLLLHGFNVANVKLGHKSADTFLEDLHKGERFDYVMANPPFNVKKWGVDKLEDDPRWEWGLPPSGNANYAFISHMIHKLKPNGKGATVLANGSLSASGKSELLIRKNFVEGNVIEAIIALPDKLFFTTGIPACIWVFSKNKKQKDILMIDASEIKGNMLNKKVRELKKEDISKIATTYSDFKNSKNIEEKGFSKAISIEELKENNYSFVPGRYVGFVEEIIDKEQIKKDILKLSTELNDQMDELTKMIPKVKEAIKKALDHKSE